MPSKLYIYSLYSSSSNVPLVIFRNMSPNSVCHHRMVPMVAMQITSSGRLVESTRNDIDLFELVSMLVMPISSVFPLNFCITSSMVMNKSSINSNGSKRI